MGRRAALALLLGASLLAAPGCGREAAEDAPGEAAARRAVPATPEVRLDRPGRRGPEDLAGPIPSFPGARPAARPAWLTGEGASFEADAAPETVLAFYREQMLADGWSLEGTTRVDDRETLAMATASRRSAAPLRRATITAEATPSGSRFVVLEWHPEL